MKGDDQATGAARAVEETPPSNRSELFGSVDQDCMPRGHRSRQLGAHGAPGAGTAPRDPNHRARWTEIAGDLLEECGLAAALGTDNRDPSSELLEPLPEILLICAFMSKSETLDAVAGKRIVGRSACQPADFTMGRCEAANGVILSLPGSVRATKQKMTFGTEGVRRRRPHHNLLPVWCRRDACTCGRDGRTTNLGMRFRLSLWCRRLACTRPGGLGLARSRPLAGCNSDPVRVAGPAHVRSTSTGVGPIRRSRRSV